MPLRVRKTAPYFHGRAVIDGKVKEINLNDFHGRYLVLLFYPMDFTYVSPTEILAFSDRTREFDHYNCSIVGVSTDSEFTHLAWMKLSKEDGGLGGVINIPLLSDKSMKISRDYGVLDRDIGISHRGLYIIDQKSVIRHITMNDLEVGRSVEETLRLLKAFQFTDKYIKVCQVDWQPGDRGLKPDPMQTGRYFEGYFGISQGKSEADVENEQQVDKSSIDEKQSNKKIIKILRSPSNDIKPPSIEREIVSDWDSSCASQQPNQHGKDLVDNVLDDLSLNVRSGKVDENASTGKGSIKTGNRTTFQTMDDDSKVNVGADARPNTARVNRTYKLYSTTVPISKALKNEQKVIASKNDASQQWKEKESDIRKDAKLYLQDSQLNQYINSYYNMPDVNLNRNKNPVVLKDDASDKPHRNELKNDEILKYNERIAKGNELKSQQNKIDDRESSSFNKTTRKSKIGSKEIDNVKVVTPHPLNDVLNVRSVNINNSNIANKSSFQKDQHNIKPTDRKANLDQPDNPQKFPYTQDQYDETKKYLKSNLYKRQQEQSFPDNASDRKQQNVGRNERTSHNFREDQQYRRATKTYPTTVNETVNQRNIDSRSIQPYVPKNIQSSSQLMLDAAKVLKSSLKRSTVVTARHNNYNTIKEERNHTTKILKPPLAIPPQYTDEKLNSNYYYSEPGERVKGRNNKNWDGKITGLNGDIKQDVIYGHLVI